MFKLFGLVDGKQVILNINQIVYIVPCAKHNSIALGMCLSCDDDMQIWHVDPRDHNVRKLLESAMNPGASDDYLTRLG